MSLFSNLFRSIPKTLLGRWERTPEKLSSIKIKLANIDHCGSCSLHKTIHPSGNQGSPFSLPLRGKSGVEPLADGVEEPKVLNSNLPKGPVGPEVPLPNLQKNINRTEPLVPLIVNNNPDKTLI
jgi:hypothetical protein